MFTSQLVFQIIPLAWAAAVSPTALSFFLVMMSMTDNPRLAGLSFYFGAIIVFLFTVILGLILGNSLISSGHSDPGTIASIDLFLGAILVLLGVKNIFGKKSEEHSGALLKYLKVENSSSNIYKFKRYFTVGFITFLINFSTAIFVLAAARQIGLANAGVITTTVAIVVLGIITLVVIEVPLIFFILFQKTGEKVMEPVNEWISSHGNILVAVFLIVIGVYVIVNGMGRLGMT
ncbi:MAG TPA: GAP family protein [Methanobacterium sp.]|nr:GAP family protein [Methanobacterium sp.]